MYGPDHDERHATTVTGDRVSSNSVHSGTTDSLPTGTVSSDGPLTVNNGQHGPFEVRINGSSPVASATTVPSRFTPSRGFLNTLFIMACRLLLSVNLTLFVTIFVMTHLSKRLMTDFG